MKLICKATIQIQKPAGVVFENIVNPGNMTHYFIATSTGRMEEKAELVWTFPEFEDKCPVSVTAIVPDRSVEFVWDPETVVRVELNELEDKSTVVKVTENGKEISENNLKWFGGNTEGWANFLACLKAFSEYGINLRKGAFDFMKQL
ncbi:MAG: ATPase [Flavobacteriia bacterium]|nr:ATPase [Flavobacteriia bacterium]OJX39144.1 MAG: ATPase [Flavobacteriia bacterium 40-80]